MVRSRVLSWFGNLVLVVVKTYSQKTAGINDVLYIYMYIYTDVDVYVYDCIVLLLMIYCILHMFVIIMGKQNINTCAKRSSPFLWPSNINAFKIKQSQHIGLVREFLDVAVTSNQWEDFLAERCHIYRSVSMREIDTLILMAKHLLRNQR